MVNTYEPARVISIIKENKGLIQKLKESGEDQMLKMNYRFNKKTGRGNSTSVLSSDPGAHKDLTKIKPQIITTNRLNTPGL